MEPRELQDPDRGRVQEKTRESMRAQEIARMEALAREEARAALWGGLTLRRRLTVAAALLFTLVIGLLIGAYGFEKADSRTGAGVLPPERWGREIELEGIGGTDFGRDATPTPWPLTVYVSGAVARAQVVEVPPGSLIIDVLEAAGGMTAGADLDALNLAAPVSDNQHVLVPTLRSTSDVPLGSGARIADSAGEIPLIDINTASVADLERLPDIGVTRAEAIIAYREANGPFRQTDDILAVPGIGPTIYERIAPLITVGP